MKKTIFCLLLLIPAPAILIAQKIENKTKRPRYGFRPELIRGPYLQVATPHSIIVRWRTDEPDYSLVRFGTRKDGLDMVAGDRDLTREHIVTLTSLSPETKYYYLIEGAKDTLQGDERNSFTTLPPEGKAGHYLIGAFGDCGNNSVNQRNTRDAFENYLGNNTLNAWILLGDNAYSFGKDAEYQSNFFNIYKDGLLKKAPLFPAPGNHDYHDERFSSTYAQTSKEVAYFQNFSMPTMGEAGGLPSHTQAYYSYDIGNIHFLSLDSHGEEENDARLFDTLGRQVQWIKKDLEANKNKGWVIAYWHHPPYTMGSHNSDTETQLRKIRENFIRILEQYGVDLVLCGHSHSYERGRLMKGYYGMEKSFDPILYDLSHSSGKYDGSNNSCPYIKGDSNQGTVYVVSGSSGALDYSQAAFPHDALPFADVSIGGATLLEIEDNRLDVKWICSDGVVRDRFTIMKGVNRKMAIQLKKGQKAVLRASYVGQYTWQNRKDTIREISVTPPVGKTTYRVRDKHSCLQDVFEVYVSDSSGVSGRIGPPAVELMRGPYLQMATDTSITVRWRTDVAVRSRVRYGAQPGKLDQTVDDLNLVTEHKVSLKGLSPFTRYYYSIGTLQDTLQTGPENYFSTLPPAGRPGVFRIGVFGDCGYLSLNQTNVRDQFIRYLGNNDLNAWILLGDNAYNDGTDAEYQSKFFNIYKDKLLKQYPLFPAPGNHDYHDPDFKTEFAQKNHGTAYFLNFSMPVNGETGTISSKNPAFYSYNIGNIHFISLDSYGMEEDRYFLYDTAGPQMQWLKKDLAANQNKGWVIAYWHHPPYSKGTHDSDTDDIMTGIRENVLRVLDNYEVDLVICGHSHVYERSGLIKGHYGSSKTYDPLRHDVSNVMPYIKEPGVGKGIVYVVTGSSGYVGKSTYSFPHPAMRYSNDTDAGAAILEVTQNRLDFKWICADGVIRDTFTMFKINAQSKQEGNTYAPLYWVDGFEYTGDAKGSVLLERQLDTLYTRGWRGIQYWGAGREGDRMNYYFRSPFLEKQSWARFGGDGLSPLVKAAHARGMKIMVNLEDVNPYHWERHHWSAETISPAANDLAATGIDGVFEECFEAKPAVFTALASTLERRNVAYVSGTDPMLLREPDFVPLWSKTGIVNVYNYYLKRDKLYNIATLAQAGSLALGWAKYWGKPTSIMSPIHRNWGIAEEYAPAVVAYLSMIRALQFRVDNFMILGGQKDFDPHATQTWINEYINKQEKNRPVLDIVVLLKPGDKERGNKAWNNFFNEGDAITSGAFNAGYNVVVSDKVVPADAYWIYTEGGRNDVLPEEVAALFNTGKKVFLQTASGFPGGKNLDPGWRNSLRQCGVKAGVPFQYAGGSDGAEASLPESQEEDLPYTGYYNNRYLRVTNTDIQRGKELRSGTIIPSDAIAGKVYCKPNSTYGKGPFVIGSGNKFAVTNASLNWEAAYIVSHLLAGCGVAPTSNVWGIAGKDVSAFLAIETTEIELVIPGLKDGERIRVVVWDKEHKKKVEENLVYHAPFRRFLHEYDLLLIDGVK
ncbi:MAG: metallophosphoesterase [Chitinophagaceae bacterium]|nr:metallophosphoesterase [Chitinophagaceae bacterium]